MRISSRFVRSATNNRVKQFLVSHSWLEYRYHSENNPLRKLLSLETGQNDYHQIDPISHLVNLFVFQLIKHCNTPNIFSYRYRTIVQNISIITVQFDLTNIHGPIRVFEHFLAQTRHGTLSSEAIFKGSTVSSLSKLEISPSPLPFRWHNQFTIPL